MSECREFFYCSEMFLTLTSMIFDLSSKDLTVNEMSECNIVSWILRLKSSTLFEETEID